MWMAKSKFLATEKCICVISYWIDCLSLLVTTNYVSVIDFLVTLRTKERRI